MNAGVLSVSLPQLSAGTETTNALLRTLIKQGSGVSLSPEEIDPPQFVEAADAVRVNKLLTVSLTCALLAAFGAMIGKQWLINLEKGGDRGLSEEDREGLQRKVQGLEEWYFRPLVEVALPTMLQIALFIFTFGFVEFLQTLNSSVGSINTWLASLGLVFILVTTAVALWDSNSPFQTPVSTAAIPSVTRLINTILFFAAAAVLFIIGVCRSVLHILGRVVAITFGSLGRKNQDKASIEVQWQDMLSEAKKTLAIPGNWRESKYHLRSGTSMLERWASQRRRKPTERTVVDAQSVCWVLTTAHDAEILLHSADIIPKIQDAAALETILEHPASVRVHQHFRLAITQLELAATEETGIPAPTSDIFIYGRAVLHLLVAIGFNDQWFWKELRQISGGPLEWSSSWEFTNEYTKDELFLLGIIANKVVVRMASSDDGTKRLEWEREEGQVEQVTTGITQIPKDQQPTYVAACIRILMESYYGEPYCVSLRQPMVEVLHEAISDEMSPKVCSVTALALAIMPDISGGVFSVNDIRSLREAYATLV